MPKNLDPQKVIVGMSGGVDSSVALLLLKKFGYQPIGVSLKYATWSCARQKENVCCTEESLKTAQKICHELGVPHQVVDVSKEFQKEVIDYFVQELKNQHTPSPCVFCNPNLKFKTLIKIADLKGAKFVATGHYARAKYDPDKKNFKLLKAKDQTKDQTYSLSFLPQEFLTRLLLPLGNLTKAEVYQIAKTQTGFELFEKRAQSQDFCFVSGHDLPDFIQQTVHPRSGQICLEDGQILGKHEGLANYTIGQRKGLKLSGGPFYVIEKDPKNNLLIVSLNSKAFNRKNIDLKDLHFNTKTPNLNQPIRVVAKIRSTQTLKPATLILKNKKTGQIIFNHPQTAVTPGQICVFYQRQQCLGGGVIG